MCSSWNGSRSLCTDRSGSRMLPNASELFWIKFLPLRRKIPLQREMWTRLVFIQWKKHGLFSNLLAFTFSTEFCDAKMNVYSFLFVCLYARLKFSAHASVFCFCLLFFYAKLRNALRQRSRPMKKRKIACACSACHTLHTAIIVNITMETPLMTLRDNCSFMLEFCRFTVSTLGVFYFLVIRAQPKKSQTLKILF